MHKKIEIRTIVVALVITLIISVVTITKLDNRMDKVEARQLTILQALKNNQDATISLMKLGLYKSGKSVDTINISRGALDV